MSEIIEAVALPVKEDPQTALVRMDDFMPLMTMEKAVERQKKMSDFIGRIMKEGTDYGTMPGGSREKVLFKAGAEKLCSFFGLTPQFELTGSIEDFTGQERDGEPLFYYRYKCALYRGSVRLGEGEASCNSFESKYRWRWVPADQVPESLDPRDLRKRGGTVFEPAFAINKGDTQGRFGRPTEYWQMFRDAIQNGTARKAEKPKKGGGMMQGWEMEQIFYRVPNPDPADSINTCQKMAQKRALVAAVLVVTNCSDSFTQDVLEEEVTEHSQPEPPPETSSDLVPEELKVAFSRLSEKGQAANTFKYLQDEMIVAAGKAGDEEFMRLAKLLRDRYPKGQTIPTHEVKATMLAMWESLTKLRSGQHSQETVTMDELPFGNTGDYPD